MGYESKIYVVQEYESYVDGRLGYGDVIEKADNAEVIAWMKEMTKGTDWYRAKLFYKFLLEIEKSGAAYSLYHFGY